MSTEVNSYEIAIDGYEPITIVARTAAKARTILWRDYSNHYPCKFGDFLRRSKTTRVENAPGVGDRILVGGVPATRVGMKGDYVRFMPDGSDIVHSAHPEDVQPLPEGEQK